MSLYSDAIEKQKIKKHSADTLDVTFIKNTDILKYVSKLKEGRPKLVVGFAAETNDLVKIDILRNTILFPKNNQYLLKENHFR